MVDVEHVAELDRHAAELLRAVRHAHEHVAPRHTPCLRQQPRRVLQVLEHLEHDHRVDAAVAVRQAIAVVELRVDAQRLRALDVGRHHVEAACPQAALAEHLDVPAQPAAEVEHVATGVLGHPVDQGEVDLLERIRVEVPGGAVARPARAGVAVAVLAHGPSSRPAPPPPAHGCARLWRATRPG